MGDLLHCAKLMAICIWTPPVNNVVLILFRYIIKLIISLIARLRLKAWSTMTGGVSIYICVLYNMTVSKILSTESQTTI